MAAFRGLVFQANYFTPDNWVLYRDGRIVAVWDGPVELPPLGDKKDKDDAPDFSAITREVANG